MHTEYDPLAFLLCLPLFSTFVCPILHAADKIRISVSGGYNMIFLSAGVAQHKGFFKDEGLDADIVVMAAPRRPSLRFPTAISTSLSG